VFVVTTSETLEQIRHWLWYHRAIGVTSFYLFVDGAAARPETAAALRAEPGVTVVPRDENLKRTHANSRVWNETWLSAFFHKPCNHELFVTQSLNMEGEPLALACSLLLCILSFFNSHAASASLSSLVRYFFSLSCIQGPGGCRLQRRARHGLQPAAPHPAAWLGPRPAPAVGIGMAREAGADWILHVDTDELIYPGGSEDYSLQVRAMWWWCVCVEWEEGGARVGPRWRLLVPPPAQLSPV
jgi:hypothetical protein